MPTLDLRQGSANVGYSRNPVSFVDRIYDAKEQTIKAASDIIKMILVPAGSLVLGVQVAVQRADTGSSTRTFGTGDSGSATQFLTTTDAKTAGLTGAPITTAKYYAAADDVRLTLNHDMGTVAAGALKVRVSAVIATFSQSTPTGTYPT